MTLEIIKSNASGIIKAPPSKSYAHRLLIAAALTNKECIIENIELSNDIQATINCLHELGYNIEFKNGNIKITKCLYQHKKIPILDCLESGSTLRFLIPVALTMFNKVIFKGTEKLMSRGLSVYEEIFKQDGIKYELTKDTLILEGMLKGGNYTVLGNISSQFITGLLFALPVLKVDSTIEIIPPIESLPYINITIDVLKKFKVFVNKNKNIIDIPKNQVFIGQKFCVEADYSNAAFLEAFNYMGGNVVVEGLNPCSIQGDKVYIEYFKLLNEGYQNLDISNCIDLGPILFTMAAFKHGARFIGTKRLAIKESNRICDVLEELGKFGTTYQILDNEVIINKCDLHSPNMILDSHNDHRIVMSLSVLASYYGGIIKNTNAVNKSFPTFFEIIKRLGVKIHDVI